MEGRDPVGTWDSGPFDNDPAWVWFNELERLDPAARAALIERALREAIDTHGYMQVDTGQAAIAAAAVVAARTPGADAETLGTPPEVHASGYVAINDRLRQLALAALDRVSGEDSEVYGLWNEGDGPSDLDDRLNALRSLLTRP